MPEDYICDHCGDVYFVYDGDGRYIGPSGREYCSYICARTAEPPPEDKPDKPIEANGDE